MKKLVFVAIIGLFAFPACSFFRPSADRAANQKPANHVNSDPAAGNGQAAVAANSPAKDRSSEITVTKKDCESVDTGDNALLKSQTFPVNFDPFRNSCFVTSYNPEYDDPPMESEIAIYKDGRKVFDFPNQFNGVLTGCWIDAVSFQDLNADGLTDVIAVGKCSAKTAPYNENVLYVNTGKAFVTDENANYKLADFKKASDAADFVKRNQQLFFK
jgi:hypothetical protein